MAPREDVVPNRGAYDTWQSKVQQTNKAQREKQYKDGGGDAKVKEFQDKGYTLGQARRATMNQGATNQRRAKKAETKPVKPASREDVVPNRGAYDTWQSKVQQTNQGSYNKVTPSVKNSKTDKMVANDNKKYGDTVPSGSFGISQKGKEQAAANRAAVQPKVNPTPTPTPTPAPKTQPTPTPTPTPTDTAPTTPEKPLASKDPSIERRLPQGAERVDKMADRVRELRAMRARSQSRIMSQGEKPVTPMVVPSAKVEKPRSGRNAMRDSNDSMDAFDLVLEYLMTTGQVDSLDEALYVMMEMDAETIQGIISEETEDSLRDRRQERGGSDGNQRYPSDRGVKKGPMSPEDKKKSREKSKSALDHVRSSITKQYGAGAIYKKKEKKDED